MELYSFRLESKQEDAIEKAEELGLAGDKSEATRRLIDQGAADLGIVNGNGVQSNAENMRLKRVLQEASKFAAYVGMAWGLVLSLYPSSSVNWAIVAPIMMALLVIIVKDLFLKYA
jgi:hypothetical protein